MTTNSVISYGFVTGEVSPDFYGRTDLDKFSLGVKEMTNFFVDYRGPAISRPGFKMAVPIGAGKFNHRLKRFMAFDDDFILVFVENVMRVFRRDGYVLRTTSVVTALINNTTVELTISGSGPVAGELLFLNSDYDAPELRGSYVRVRSVSGSGVTVETLAGEDIVASETTLGSAPTIARVYQVATPFTNTQLPNLRFEQDKTRIVITSNEVRRHEVLFASSDLWLVVEIPNENDLVSPSRPSVSASSGGSAGAAFAVTATINGKESPASETRIANNIVNYTVVSGSMSITWDAVPDASLYTVYRSLVVPDGDNVTGAEFLGVIGQTYTTQFTDANVVADFSVSPPGKYNPFANGSITNINVTSQGSGYSASNVVTISGGLGSDFEGSPIVDSSGRILSIVINDPGQDYELTVVLSGSTPVPSNYSINISGGGSGAEMYASATEVSGNDPRCYTKFQQRDLFAGSLNFPMTLWATRPSSPNDFSVSPVVNAGDGYVFEIDDNTIQPINHALALRSGLLLFTQTGVFLLRAEEGKAVSGVNALSEPQAYKGSSNTRPILIDIDVLFVENKGSSLNAMMYTEYTNTFKMQDISVLANHFVEGDKRITDMKWISEPNRLLHCLREDGRIAYVTYERPNEVYGWALTETAGLFKQIEVGSIDGIEYLHAGIERTLPSGNVTYLEVAQTRKKAYIEDMFLVDCGLSYEPTIGLTDLIATTSFDDDTILTTVDDGFAAVSVDDVIFFGGARAIVTAVTSTNEITIDYERAMTAVHPQTDPAVPNCISAGEWEFITKTDTVGGLWHLEGASVSVLADGDAYENLIVSSGTITLDKPAARIHIGLPYLCTLTTLSPTFAQQIIEGKKKDIVSASLRTQETRGIAVGMEDGRLDEVKNRTTENWGEQLRALADIVEVGLNSGWNYDRCVTIQQRYPLPAKLLSLTMEVMVGDD